jgi:hypothetical protein
VGTVTSSVSARSRCELVLRDLAAPSKGDLRARGWNRAPASAPNSSTPHADSPPWTPSRKPAAARRGPGRQPGPLVGGLGDLHLLRRRGLLGGLAWRTGRRRTPSTTSPGTAPAWTPLSSSWSPGVSTGLALDDRRPVDRWAGFFGFGDDGETRRCSRRARALRRRPSRPLLI